MEVRRDNYAEKKRIGTAKEDDKKQSHCQQD